MNSEQALRDQIHQLVTEYYQQVHASQQFVPGETRVQYGGRVYDEEELIAVVDACLDFWLTAGPRTEALERKLATYIGVRDALVTNSGSSANLVAISSLRSHRLDQPLQPGDEVITPAVGFPTTVAPIVQNDLVPVFIDCQLGTYNLDPSQLAPALSERTQAIFFAHALGNPVEMEPVMDFAREHDLYVIEDTCDALGTRYDGQLVGSFGDLATLSFYPAHHITTGEGGAVLSNDEQLTRIARSIRDWGRDCWCTHSSPPGGACGRRFEWKIPGLDEPYDHRYLFVELGYNLKMTDMQAAIGITQMSKLPMFTTARKKNFAQVYEGLKAYEEFLILPRWSEKADPSWFAFPISVRPEAPFKRRQLTDWLEAHNVETRLLFAGNVVRQPGYRHIHHRAIGDLTVADQVLRTAFFFGVYPGLKESQIAYILDAFAEFFKHL